MANHRLPTAQADKMTTTNNRPPSPVLRPHQHHVVMARTFRMAAQALVDVPVADVSVDPRYQDGDDNNNDNLPPGLLVAQPAGAAAHAVIPHEHNGADDFCAFVSSLQNSETVESVAFFHHDFGRPRRADGIIVKARETGDVDRLFTQVLPNHRSITSVRFGNHCGLPPGTFDAFVDALSTRSRIRRLVVHDCPLTGRDVRAVAAMLRRNVPGTHVKLRNWIGNNVPEERGGVDTAGGQRGSGPPRGGTNNDDDDDDGDTCRILCDACAHNSHIESLALCDSSLIIDQGGVAGVAGPASTLARLRLQGAWTAAGLENLLFQLRTNETIVYCDASNSIGAAQAPAVPSRWVEELLLTYNWTLRTLHIVGSWTNPELMVVRINVLLRNNQRVREAHEHLEKRNYGVGLSAAVWPRALEIVSRFPTLVYRFVRRGNVPALSEHLRISMAGADRLGHFERDS